MGLWSYFNVTPNYIWPRLWTIIINYMNCVMFCRLFNNVYGMNSAAWSCKLELLDNTHLYLEGIVDMCLPLKLFPSNLFYVCWLQGLFCPHWSQWHRIRPIEKSGLNLNSHCFWHHWFYSSFTLVWKQNWADYIYVPPECSIVTLNSVRFHLIK